MSGNQSSLVMNEATGWRTSASIDFLALAFSTRLPWVKRTLGAAGRSGTLHSHRFRAPSLALGDGAGVMKWSNRFRAMS